MFISRMALNPARRGAVELLASPYRMHAAVERAFPPVESDGEEDGRVLWRLDAGSDGSTVWLYVVSPRQPDFTHVVEQAAWPTTGTWETKDYEPLLASLREGQRWGFRLRANPVRKVLADKGSEQNGKVVGTIQGHVTAKQQEGWLLSRCGSRGFVVSTDDIGNPLLMLSQRSRRSFSHGSAGKITLATVLYDGILEVTDAQEFERTLRWGMGRAKGFGCGLLTIAPVTVAPDARK
ncbi:MAG: type I-E CRISPR-associated protein Cas6/Cse3/CasE [Acidobacteriota bacterium]|nr:type I-E CRISPR-associated protein Cas6/Cse3/CasE [Acidobacteriota bacterium]